MTINELYELIKEKRDDAKKMVDALNEKIETTYIYDTQLWCEKNRSEVKIEIRTYNIVLKMIEESGVLDE